MKQLEDGGIAFYKSKLSVLRTMVWFLIPFTLSFALFIICSSALFFTNDFFYPFTPVFWAFFGILCALDIYELIKRLKNNGALITLSEQGIKIENNPVVLWKDIDNAFKGDMRSSRNAGISRMDYIHYAKFSYLAIKTKNPHIYRNFLYEKEDFYKQFGPPLFDELVFADTSYLSSADKNVLRAEFGRHNIPLLK